MSNPISRRTATARIAATTLSMPFISKTLAQSRDPIVIGHQADLTGPFASWGLWMDRAGRAAVDLCNANGGIAGRKVQYIVEDAAGNPAEGVRKFRAMVDRQNAAFVIGANHSGVNLATNPIAREMKVPYFANGMAEEKTGEKGNRYVFQVCSDTYIQAAAGTYRAFQELGNEWTFIFSDFAWGWSHFNEQSRILKQLGAKINEPIAVPLDAKDYLPYLARVPSSTKVIYPIAGGSAAVSLFTQIRSMRLDQSAKVYSVICTHEAIAPKDLNGASEGFRLLEYHPRALRFKNTPFNQQFFKALNVNPEDGREIGGNRVAAMSHAYSAWESVFFIKKAIEKSGWKSPAETAGFIQALEGMSVAESIEHPQGAKRIRAEDHKSLSDIYYSQVENGQLVVKDRIKASDFESRMPPKVNFTTEKV